MGDNFWSYCTSIIGGITFCNVALYITAEYGLLMSRRLQFCLLLWVLVTMIALGAAGVAALPHGTLLPLVLGVEILWQP